MKRKLKYIFLILLICIAAALFLSSSVFQISKVVVSGNNIVSKDEIIRLSAIHQGQNIFRINVKKSMRGIFLNPYVKMIKIKRKLPSTVNINIIEREAVALVPYVGSYLNIDEDAMIMKISTPEEKIKLPIINGMNFNTFKIGEILDIEDKKQLDSVMKVITEIKNFQMTDKIVEIDVTDVYNIKLKTDSEIKINLGDDRKLSHKIGLAKSIIEDLEAKNLKGTVDMSYDGNPIFSSEQ